MPFLYLNSILLKVTRMSERPPIMIGEQVRAVDGTLLTDYRGQKKVWDIDALLPSQAEYEALTNAIDNWEEVPMAGDALGTLGSTTVVVTQYEGDYERSRASFERSIRMTIEQV